MSYGYCGNATIIYFGNATIIYFLCLLLLFFFLSGSSGYHSGYALIADCTYMYLRLHLTLRDVASLGVKPAEVYVHALSTNSRPHIMAWNVGYIDQEDEEGKVLLSPNVA